MGLARLAVIVGVAVDNTGGETGTGGDGGAEYAEVANARVRMEPAKRAWRLLKCMVSYWQA